ncbi:MAG TPA: DUF2231 domain-containing protein [Acidimicrobiia bacterium]|nr:DUF2231 domain-containing protein [Acidimicrobiia bacterium]
MKTPPWARGLIRSVAEADGLDDIAAAAQRVNRRVIGDGALADVLRGTWLGHPLHPVLTDLPIGFWTCAMVLDVFGGATSAAAARNLVGWGVVSAVPTAAAGAVDWRDTRDGDRRIGAVHAALNVTAIGCYVWSWFARRDHRARGIALGFVGATAATAAAYFGGELVFPSDPTPQQTDVT